LLKIGFLAQKLSFRMSVVDRPHAIPKTRPRQPHIILAAALLSLTEDEIARRKLGPRGLPGAPDTATITPEAVRG
jgi:hypothetical protein